MKHVVNGERHRGTDRRARSNILQPMLREVDPREAEQCSDRYEQPSGHGARDDHGKREAHAECRGGVPAREAVVGMQVDPFNPRHASELVPELARPVESAERAVLQGLRHERAQAATQPHEQERSPCADEEQDQRDCCGHQPISQVREQSEETVERRRMPGVHCPVQLELISHRSESSAYCEEQ